MTTAPYFVPALFALGAIGLLLLGWLYTAFKLTSLRTQVAASKRTLHIGQTLQENPSLGLITADNNGLITFISPAAELLLGYSARELVGQERTTVLYSRDELHDEITALVRDLGEAIVGAPEAARLRLQTGSQAHEKDWALVRKDGTQFFARVMLSSLRSSKGKPDGFILTFRDISEYRAITRAAQARQSQMEELFRHAPAAIALLDEQLRYVAVSQRWITDYAVRETQIIGRPHLELLPTTPRHWRDIYRRCLAGTSARGDDDTVALSDGTEQPARWECVPWRDASGHVGGIVIFTELLTEKRRAEKLLLENEARLRSAQQLARLGSWTYDLSNKRMQWSPQALSLHDLPENSSPSLDTAFTFYPETHRPQLIQAMDRAIRTGTPWDLELPFQTATGRDLWIRSLGRADQKTGQPTHIEATLQDITELKNTSTALTRAKDEALELARTKADFLANMSHEIRTPLNAVAGMTGLLLNTPLDPEQREYADTIRSASDTLLDLINDILDFSKIESGKMELEQQPYSLHDCIETAIDLVSPQSLAKKLELGYWIDPEIPSALLGDVTRIRQVLVNLLSNAVKFTAQGEVLLTVTIKDTPGHSPRLKITVRDTGIGIPPDRMDRLFKNFSQVDSSTTRTYGGTGLGLAICRRLCELMQGHISVESILGLGSLFHVELPLLRAGPDFDLPSPTRPSLLGLRTLVIEDHASTREILRLSLESMHASVETCSTPLAATALLRSGEHFDLLIVDHLMPDMDGLEFTHALHAANPEFSAPIILLTPKGRRSAASADGLFSAVLSKPLKPRQLEIALARILRQTATATEPKPAELPPLSPIRLLVVEDNPVNQRVARVMLADMGLRADLAADGLDALRALQTHTYDLILMDVQMPEMDGLAATREIRRILPPERQPVIIAMTAHTSPESRTACMDAGMDDFLAKPVRPEDLRTRIARWQKLRAQVPQTSSLHT